MKDHPQSSLANRIVMSLAGMMLIVAAGLKAQQIVSEPIISEGFWESWAFFVIQVPLEFGLGVWLCCGLFRKVAWLLGSLAFGGFIIVTLVKGLVGAESCGCFGQIHVNPWITLVVVDIPLFLLLLIFRPPANEKFLPPPWPNPVHFFGVAVPTLTLIGLIVPILLTNKVERFEVKPTNQPLSVEQQQKLKALQQKLSDQTPPSTATEPTSDPQRSAPQPLAPQSEPCQPADQADHEPTQPPAAGTADEPIPGTDDGTTPATTADTTVEAATTAQTAATTATEATTETPPAEATDEATAEITPNPRGTDLTATSAETQQCELLDHIDIGDQLREEIAIILFYYNTCPDCKDAIPVYDRQARQWAGNEDSIKIAFVEIPPYGDIQPHPAIPEDTPCLLGKLDDSRKWGIVSPLVIILMDGQVVQSWEARAPDFDEILSALFG